jgi:hypothetical protein
MNSMNSIINRELINKRETKFAILIISLHYTITHKRFRDLDVRHETTNASSGELLESGQAISGCGNNEGVAI